MIQLILTHPGGAHKDEFLACAVLLSQYTVSIHRREPTDADLMDSSIAVVDVGGEHTEASNNFDHHQFPREQIPTCSLSLVLQHLGLYEAAQQIYPWLEITEWFDCRGPGETAKKLGIDREILSQLNSPIDIILLKQFASENEFHPGDPVWEIMRMIGAGLVDFIRNFQTRIDFVKKHAQIWNLKKGGSDFKALFMPRTEPLPDEPSSGLGHHVYALGLEKEIITLIYPDSRSEGYGLRRFDDSLQMDFQKIQNEADVHFAHAQGFIAKTSSAEVDRLKSLVSAAFIE